MIVARPLRPGEPDLLLGKEYASLVVRSLTGEPVATVCAPGAGWDHGTLEAQAAEYSRMHPTVSWDAYLDDRWVGSSEV